MTYKDFANWEFELFQKPVASRIRLGAMWMNDHGISAESDPVLFNEPDDVKARQHIFDTYLKSE